MPSTPVTTHSAIRAILIDEDPSVRGQIRDGLLAMGDVEVITETDNLVFGYEMIRQHHPELVFIDLRGERSLEILRRIGMYFKDIMVVVSGYQLDVQTIMTCMQAGAREYLRRPFATDDITALYRRHRASLGESGQGDQSGRIVTVYANKGGLGKTTIAINTATAIAQSTGEDVALVDLNLQLGDISTILDIKPRQTVSDIINNLSQVDEAYLRSSMTPVSTERGQLFVLADPVDVEEAEDITPEQLVALLAMLKATFSYIVVDISGVIDPRNIAILDQSDTIMLTTMMNLPCIRNTQRVLGLCQRLGYDRHKVKLVVNRYVPSDEITLEDIEETLDYEVFWKFPNNYFAVIASINQAIPLYQLGNGKELYQSFVDFARQLLGLQPASKKLGPAPQHSKAQVGRSNASAAANASANTSNQDSSGLWGLLGKTLQNKFSTLQNQPSTNQQPNISFKNEPQQPISLQPSSEPLNLDVDLLAPTNPPTGG
jgi:pilus assembly protein CpaE